MINSLDQCHVEFASGVVQFSIALFCFFIVALTSDHYLRNRQYHAVSTCLNIITELIMSQRQSCVSDPKPFPSHKYHSRLWYLIEVCVCVCFAVDRSLAQCCSRAWGWRGLECLSPVFDLGTWTETFAPWTQGPDHSSVKSFAKITRLRERLKL